MAAETGSTYISGTAIDSVAIQTVNPFNYLRKCSQMIATSTDYGIRINSIVFRYALLLYMYLCNGNAKTTFLWPPYGIGQAIIFSSYGFFLLSYGRPACSRCGQYTFAQWFLFLSSFFPRLISAVAEWMSTIHLDVHMVWP